MNEEIKEEIEYFLEGGGEIDCGTTIDTKLQVIQSIHDLGFNMGEWYYSRIAECVGEPDIPWRYLYLENNYYHPGQIHMRGGSGADEVMSFFDFVDLFSEDDEEMLDLSALYHWA